MPRSSRNTATAYLGLLGADFTVAAPTELVGLVRTLAARYHRATGS